MVSSSKKTVLITGATGQQGRAVITALLEQHRDSAGMGIIAVTRSPSSPAAQRLGCLSPSIRVIAGDLSDPAAIFVAAGEPVWAVYTVQVNSDAEEAQGKALVDAAARHGVRHFVYSSGDRGGLARSDANPTDVRNFRAKYEIERHLRARAEACGMTYTILRPVTFFENLGGDLHGRGFARMWAQMGREKKLQFVATADIGWFAAQSLAFPGDARYRNEALTLVGDELTQAEADIVFRDVLGGGAGSSDKPRMPMAPCLVGSAVKWVKRDTVGDMFAWFEREGYGGSVQECRTWYPGMRDWKAWLAENRGRWEGWEG
ncbi:hypothetical protein JX266_002603 [Neoarthrinium moseri]|nr:hypothetical protein JX266_002603 [Neoarthrinium moseri]